MKKFKRGKYLFGSLLVFAFVTTLLLNLKQENENLRNKNIKKIKVKKTKKLT